VEQLIVELTGAEDALIVNNCVAAAFFVLKAFADGGEVIVSRGELVEIGGDFRVPDVLAQSGAALREIGTTNRTKLADYERAIGERTRVLLRVHPSNYRIVGFTAAPALSELSALARKNDLLLYEDIGSGALIDLARRGIADEPVVSASLAAGVDVVTFSGDKLLGGPQAGIIAGRSAVIKRLRGHPLYRALRVDKLIYAALESTLLAYRRGTPDEIPVVLMLSMTKQEIRDRVEMFAKRVAEGRDDDNLNLETRDDFSAIGGGAAPVTRLETTLVALSHRNMSTSRLEKKLRDADPAVVARILDDRVVLDLRTVAESEENELLAALVAL
ncbi:MAG TPA: L-seryl-tRNA(Sec) selenium transferase, partial [Pyrinomonadaceae bacterium]|nr:L-seryl-tRNA(Sec) selenium transferase [Pyrinomonadaceae bacterium]